jgi:hypothetical protein
VRCTDNCGVLFACKGISFDEALGFCLNKLFADGVGARFLGSEIDLPLALRGVISAALEMVQSVNAKKAVKINTCAESLLIGCAFHKNYYNILTLI